MSKTLTTNDTADVLDALLPAQNEYHSLGLALKLSPYEVKAIYTANHRPQDCLREVIIKFLEQAPESRRNWRVIADALASRIVNHQGLSETVKAAHLPATSIVIEPVSDDLAALTGDVPSNISGMLQSNFMSIHLMVVIDIKCSHKHRHGNRLVLITGIASIFGEWE